MVFEKKIETNDTRREKGEKYKVMTLACSVGQVSKQEMGCLITCED
jgi:hypothetical protein